MLQVQPQDFARLLKRWRATRKLSQLDLSLEAGVSQRHLSFLESRRARPSRAMVQQLGAALDLPLRERNHLLVAAGFAPVFEHRELDDPDMAPVLQALKIALTHHEPNPAVVVDRHWNVVMANDALLRMLALMGDMDAMWDAVCPQGKRNILKLTFHPDGARPYLANWREIAPLMLARLRRDAENSADPELIALLDEIRAYPGIPALWAVADWHRPPPPILPLDYVLDGKRLRLFSLIATFDTAQDVTTDELRIESFFPADEDTAALLRQLAQS